MMIGELGKFTRDHKRPLGALDGSDEQRGLKDVSCDTDIGANNWRCSADETTLVPLSGWLDVSVDVTGSLMGVSFPNRRLYTATNQMREIEI